MVFISHRKADEDKARDVKKILDSNNIRAFLDVLDPDLADFDNASGSDITNVITKNLDNCSHLLMIFSENTQGSMWVPFEVGYAYHADKGIAVYEYGYPKYPEYLEDMPRLTSDNKLEVFINMYTNDKIYSKEKNFSSLSLEQLREEFNQNELKSSLGAKGFINQLNSRLRDYY